MSKEDIPEIIHAAVVLTLVISILAFTIIALDRGWL